MADWWPTAMERLTGYSSIEIVPFKNTTKEEIEKKIVAAGDVALHVIDNLQRHPLLLCLCSEETIFTFSFPDEIDGDFINSIIKNSDLKIFTSEGSYDAEYLNNFKVDLTGAIDLTAFATCLDVKDYMNENPGEVITMTKLLEKVKPPGQYYQDLVCLFAGPDIELKYHQSELENLHITPYNIVARNIIKKRCGAIRSVGLQLTRKHVEEIEKPSRSIFALGIRAADEVWDEYKSKGDRKFLTVCNTLSFCPSGNDHK